MMNKRLIVEMLKESEAVLDSRSSVYERANENEKTELFESYVAALSVYDACVQMVLAFGYMIQRDDNYKIIGIKKAK